MAIQLDNSFFDTPQALLSSEDLIPVHQRSLADRVSYPPIIHHSDSAGELRSKFLEAIRAANTSIECMTFTFSDREICDLLGKKAEEGIEVTVAIDKNHLSASLLALKDKINLVVSKSDEGRFHHKTAVIDGENVWIGSANFSPAALVIQNNTMIQLRSKELAQALHNEVEALSGNRIRASSQLLPIQVGDQATELLLFPSVPFRADNTPEKRLNDAGKNRIIELIDSATTSLRLAVCVWTDPDLAQAVIRAKNRGVDVEVIVWKKEESLVIFNHLNMNDVKIIEKPHLPLMHHKWMIVDNKHFLNCSANWSKSWFSRNDESAIILNHLTQDQQESLNSYWDKLYVS